MRQPLASLGGSLVLVLAAAHASGCGPSRGGGAGGGVVVPGSTALAVATTSLPGATSGVPYSVTLAATNVSGTPSWTLVSGALPPGIALTSSGVLAGTPIASQATVAAFEVQVTDSTNASARVALSIAVSAPSLVATASPLPDGAVGQSYLVTFSAPGVPSPLTWTAISGPLALPSGLTLSTDGTLSGVPTSAGVFTFEIGVRGSAGAPVVGSGSKVFQLTINASGSPSVTTPGLLPAATLGRPYFLILAATGGLPPYRWSTRQGSTPPVGLALSTDGVLSGTPGARGSFAVEVTLDDSSLPASRTTSATLLLAVN